MKKLLAIFALVVGCFTVIGCEEKIEEKPTEVDTDENEANTNELENGIFHTTGTGGFKGDVSLSIEIEEEKIKSIKPLLFKETDSFWKTAFDGLKDKLVGLDYDQIDELSIDGDSSDAISGATKASTGIINAVKQVLTKKLEDVVFDFTPYSTVNEFMNKYEKLFTSIDLGNTTNRVITVTQTDVDFTSYLTNEILALEIDGTQYIPFVGQEGYDDAFYAMPPTSSVSFRDVQAATDIKLIIKESDDSEPTETPAFEELDNTEITVTNDILDVFNLLKDNTNTVVYTSMMGVEIILTSADEATTYKIDNPTHLGYSIRLYTTEDEYTYATFNSTKGLWELKVEGGVLSYKYLKEATLNQTLHKIRVTLMASMG